MKKRVNLTKVKKEIEELESLDYSSLDQDQEKMSLITYGYVNGFRLLIDSLKKKSHITFVSGVLAGIWIGIAYMACIYASYHIPNSSVQKLMVGAIFPFVLTLIYFLGGGFLTAYMSLSWPMTKTIRNWKNYLKTMTIIYLGNIVGSMIIALFLQLGWAFSNTEVAKYIFENMGLSKLYLVGNKVIQNYNDNIGNLLATVTAKDVILTVISVFFSAIICNMLVSMSAQVKAMTKNNILAGIVMFWIVIFMFAISGYQHCVANWFIGFAMLFIGLFSGSGTEIANASIIFGLFVLLNILPAIIGNYVGAFFMSFLLSIFSSSYSKLVFSEARLDYLKTEYGELLEGELKKTTTVSTKKK